jgi:hypothetical protein
VNTADSQRSKRPVTPKEVIERLIWKGWNAEIAFYEGSRVCRRLDAELIRGAVVALRKRRALSIDIRALIAAVEPSDPDEVLRRDWQDAIDGLRVLFHASPAGTSRQRQLLLGVARNRKLIAAMRVASMPAQSIDPTWMAVLIAEGSPESNAVVAKFTATYAKNYPDLLRKLELFRGALDGGAASRPTR